MKKQKIPAGLPQLSVIFNWQRDPRSGLWVICHWGQPTRLECRVEESTPQLARARVVQGSFYHQPLTNVALWLEKPLESFVGIAWVHAYVVAFLDEDGLYQLAGTRFAEFGGLE